MNALDRIDWTKLHHAGGTADDIPDMIRALHDPEVRADAIGALLESVFDYDEEAHRCAVFDSTPHVVPFLAALIDLDPGDDADLEEDQAFLSDLLVDLATSVSEAAEAAAPAEARPHDAATREALRANVPWVFEQPDD